MKNDVYDKAIRKWGVFSQSIKAVEEMSELQKELCKACALEADGDHIAEEIADVEIMLEQVKRMYHCSDKVQVWKAKKLERLWERVGA